MRWQNTPLAILIATVLVLFSTSTVWAYGTADNEQITNTANVAFTINGTTTTTPSNTVTFEIDTKVRPIVTNISGTGVVAGVDDFALPFTVTNEGNSAAGSEYFELSVEADATDDFDMASVRIYTDLNGDGLINGLDADITGTPVVSISNVDGSNSLNYLIVANTPAAGGTPDTGAPDLESIYHLVATAWAGANVGDGALADDTDGNDPNATEVVYADDAGSAPSGDVVLDGFHSDSGTFTTLATLVVTKGASDGSLSGYHIPGDDVTYTITTTNGDPNFDATGVTISDEIPGFTIFKPLSLSCPATFTPEYSADAKGSPASTWAAAETSPVNHVRCYDGTILQGAAAVNMTFVITID